MDHTALSNTEIPNAPGVTHNPLITEPASAPVSDVDAFLLALDSFITACQHLILSPLVAILVTAMVFLFVFARKFSY